MYKKEIQKIDFEEFGKTYIKIKIYKKEIQKIVFDELGKT